MNIEFYPIIASAAAFLLSLIIIPIIIKFSHKKKWYDIPNNRKIHKGLIPRTGGIGIFISFLLSAFIISYFIYIFAGETAKTLLEPKYILLFSCLLVVSIMGLIDDLITLTASLKLVIQFLTAAFITFGGFIIKTFSIPYFGTIHLGIFAYPITIIWIVSIANAINLVDGMDGLAGGISGFAALSLGIISLIQGRLPTAIISFSIFGAIVGFLRYNLPPAIIFMGDSGSMLIGFTLAVLPLTGISKAASLGTLIIPITLLTVPIIDILSAVIRRIINKRPIISPDKEHIHHKLLDIGMSEKKILILIYGFCFYLSIVSITSVILPKQTNVFLILVVWIGSMLGYYFLDASKIKKSSENSSDSNIKKDSSA